MGGHASVTDIKNAIRQKGSGETGHSRNAHTQIQCEIDIGSRVVVGGGGGGVRGCRDVCWREQCWRGETPLRFLKVCYRGMMGEQIDTDTDAYNRIGQQPLSVEGAGGERSFILTCREGEREREGGE